jgi:thioredoxin-related protein
LKSGSARQLSVEPEHSKGKNLFGNLGKKRYADSAENFGLVYCDKEFEMARPVAWCRCAMIPVLIILGGMIGCADSGKPSPPGSETGTTASSAPSVVPSTYEKVEATDTVTAAKEPIGESPQQAAEQTKPKREPIYDTQTPGRELIDKAIKQAQRDHKRVLIEWGFNTCIWCVRLHDTFKKDALVQPLIHEEFVLVLIDSTENGELMREYGGKDRRYSFPHLTVLDAQGEMLTNQNTEPLEKGSAHDPQVVAEFLTKWSAPKEDAEEVVAKALERAGADRTRVLLRVGTPYCGWCHVLAQFTQDHAELLSKDYVDIKIDTLRMTNGEAVASRYQPVAKESLGVPWFVILDETGKTLATSVGPKGNIGYPFQAPEIDHFIGMLRETRQKLTDAELEQLRTDLVAYREERERKQAR